MRVAAGFGAVLALLVGCLPLTASSPLGAFSFEYNEKEEQLSVFWNGPNNSSLALFQSVPSSPWIFMSWIQDVSKQADGFFKLESEQNPSFPMCADARVTSVSETSLEGSICTTVPSLPNLTFAVTFGLSHLSSNQLQFNTTVVGLEKWNSKYRPSLGLRYATSSGEGFFGLGEQYTEFNMRGKKIDLFSKEKGAGRGLEPLTFMSDQVKPNGGGSPTTSYFASPLYLTSEMRAMYLTNTETVHWDFACTEPNAVLLSVNASSLSSVLVVAADPFAFLEEVTLYTGRMAPLPTWASQGAIVGMEGGTDVVSSSLDTIARVIPSMPFAGVWIQDWSGLRQFSNRLGVLWNWELDTDLYHSWPQLTERLSQWPGGRVRWLAYINPMLANATVSPTPRPHNYKQEAADQGFLVQRVNQDGSWETWNGYNEAGLVDLSKPEAYSWFKELIKRNVLAQNISGWMADFAESYPLNGVNSTMEPAQLHNLFPILWQQCCKEAVAEAGMLEEVVYFGRSGASKSPSVGSLFWLGDQLTSWDHFDGIKTAVTGMLSLGLSGISLTHSDLGGYDMIDLRIPGFNYTRTKELFLRWCELSAFTALYRSHPGAQPKTAWQWNSDEASMLHFARFATVFATLADYRIQLMGQAEAKGYPLVRALLLHYPEDSEAWALPLQFLLGADFLVAPVLDEAQTMTDVYLPQGTWRHIWTNKTFGDETSGMWLRGLSAPIGSPPFFHRTAATSTSALADRLSNL